MPTSKNISDKAIILARIDYGEKDRIITVLSQEHGKLKAIAKSVRSGKSKLAGGIELFAENHLILLKGRGDLYMLTSSRMDKFYGNITSDIDRAMYAYDCLKNVNKLTVDEEGSEYYPYLSNVLASLNDKNLPLGQIKIWFGLKLLNLIGVEPNLKTLSTGAPLPPNKKYNFDFDHQCFAVHESGKYNQNHIKILRYLNSKKLFVKINKLPNKNALEVEGLSNFLLQEHLK
ncbi:DNA repair protein RecO [Candidatus Parcubacteria bacterium]|nr:DNA repair protein RecO [Candidatus Parcubacteria bacterium]